MFFLLEHTKVLLNKDSGKIEQENTLRRDPIEGPSQEPFPEFAKFSLWEETSAAPDAETLGRFRHSLPFPQQRKKAEKDRGGWEKVGGWVLK